MSDTITQIQARPQYIQEYDEALLQRFFGSPDEEGVLTGGLIDDPELFQIPDYVQATSPLQSAVAATFATPEQRQAFFDRYQPYFMDEEGFARYLPEASSELSTGAQTIEDALLDYFPEAETYLQAGRGGIGAKSIYDTELAGAKSRADQATDAFSAQERADALFGEARGEIKGGLGSYTVDKDALRKGTETFAPSDELGQARERVAEAGEGEFGAREAFERGTGRALELAEQGLGQFDPGARTQAFMDPYKEQVVDAALSKIDREAAKRRQSDAAKAVAAGAFGGSRSGVQAAETERAVEEAKQSTVANLMSQGYDKAMANAIATDEAARKRALQASGLTGQIGTSGASLEAKAYEDAAKRGLAAATTGAGLSQAEEQLRMSGLESGAARTMAAEQGISQAEQKAFEDAQKRQIAAGQALGGLGSAQLGAESSAFESAEQRMLKSADMYRSMGLSSADAQAKAAEDEKKRSLEAGRLMGGLGQTTGALGGAQADIGKAYGALAGTSADVGRVYAGMQPADLGFMYELGGKERAYGQQQKDFARQNQLLTTQQALAPYSYGQTFLTGSPSASMYGQFTTQPSTAPNPFLSGVGAYATLQGMNQQ